MYSECDEVADAIWEARSMTKGNGLNSTAPIRNIDDALAVARHQMPDESETVISNVAERLLELSRRNHTTMKG